MSIVADLLMQNVDKHFCFGFFRDNKDLAYVIGGDSEFVKNKIFRLMNIFPHLCIVSSSANLKENSATKYIIQKNKYGDEIKRLSLREYIFRGKRTDNDEWIYGYFFQNQDGIFIFGQHELGLSSKEVFPETVGMFTGFFDKKAQKVFEGDIGYAFDGVTTSIVVVVWDEKKGRYILFDPLRFVQNHNIEQFFWRRGKSFECIDNVEANSDLAETINAALKTWRAL